jgi:hypothetical protein
VKPEHSLRRSEHIGVFSVYNARKFLSVPLKQIEVLTIYPPDRHGEGENGAGKK